MATGYLDLLQRELRDAVVHPFSSTSDLVAHSAVEGQIASVNGSLFIFAADDWRRILSEDDFTSISVELERRASMYKSKILYAQRDAHDVVVMHGFEERPLVSVTDPFGESLIVQVVHDDVGRRCRVQWAGTLSTPATVMCIGQAISTGGG